MKKVRSFILCFGMLLTLALAATGLAEGAELHPREPAAADHPGTGMPGWPVPDKPIPQHEPGHLAQSLGYQTETTRLNQVGGEQTLQLTGLDAMVADGLDPLAGSYRLVSKDAIALGYLGTTDTFPIPILKFKSYENTTLDFVPGSALSMMLAPLSLELIAEDLNGDGVDEQIAVWVDGSTKNIFIAIGEMPGSNG
ncbi:MAG: hypothetical protein JW862_00570, partial [Anaerolineales bacterium]|nr:hypothetical protein [Anaerolineales bacterium]